MPQLWAGVDAGKAHHHCVVIDPEGTTVLSRRVPNDETELLELIADVRELSANVLWAIDLNAGGGALLIALLINHDQRLLYIPGRAVHHASGGYRGSGKSDAKDAFIIADQARMRRDLHPMTASDEIAVDLRILTARRYDLVADRTRAINRLRAQILEYFPALERAFDYSGSKAALVLLTGFPDSRRAAGDRPGRARRLVAGTEGPQQLGDRRDRARRCAGAVHHRPGPEHGRGHGGAAGEGGDGPRCRDRGDRCPDRGSVSPASPCHRDPEHAGIGPMLGADIIGLTGGNLAAFGSADRLAGVAGLAPVPRDSGRVQGNQPATAAG